MSEATQPAPFWMETTPVIFPATTLALLNPNGLLAIGGNLTPEWLLQAYRNGIFPWFNLGEPILWWTPNPRSVLFLKDLHIQRSLRKTLNQIDFNESLTVTLDQDFSEVMRACSISPRKGQEGTWITEEMLSAYNTLHTAGHAHSVEVWQDGQLVGGLYGIAIGKMFYGESMFSKISNGSKVALVALSMQLQAWGFKLMDVQIETPHLNNLGAIRLSRDDFEQHIQQQMQLPFAPQKWQLSLDWLDAAEGHYQIQNS